MFAIHLHHLGVLGLLVPFALLLFARGLGDPQLVQIVLMGVAGAFLTGDIFNLYVWFEVMLIGSFVLMSLHRTRAQLHAAFTYVGLNLLASAFLLTAIGLLDRKSVV